MPPIESGFFTPSNESSGLTSNAEPLTDSGALSSIWQRAAYQGDQPQPPAGTNSNSGETPGGDAQGFGAQPGTPWRASYGSDVASTIGNQQQQVQAQQSGWRKPYGADAPLVVPSGQQTGVDYTSNSGKAGDIDPLTGQPLIRKTEQAPPTAASTHPVDSAQSGSGLVPGAATVPNWQLQAEIKQKRALVDRALESSPVGFEGNLIAGGIGGLVGGRVVPFLMNRYTRGVNLEPDQIPSTFRERVAKTWQDNYNPKSWNGPDLQFVNKQIHGPNGLAKQMGDFNKAVQTDLDWYSQRAQLFKPFTQVDTFADDVERMRAAKNAISANQQAVKANNGEGKALFSEDELKYLEDLKQPGATMTVGLQEAIDSSTAAKAFLGFRADTFSTLSDTKIPLALKSDGPLSRLSTVNNAITSHEQDLTSGGSGLFTPDELSALKEYQSAAQSTLNATKVTAAGKVKGFFDEFGPSIVKGVGVAGTLMVVDHYADQLLFGKNHGNGIGDSINSALVPAALLVTPETGTLTMAAVGTAALLGGKLIGSSLSSGEIPTYSRYFNQSTGESFLLAAESLLPLKPTVIEGVGEVTNWKRAALIGATWLAFRGINMLLDPPPQADIKDQAFNLLKSDANKRTDGSMTDAIDKFLALGHGDEAHGIMTWSNVFKEGEGRTKGARGEAALQVYRTEWLTKPTNEFDSMLAANRGATILCTAFAESRLAHGTQVPTITDMPTYLLEGKDLDLGGKAARDFIIARINIDNAEKQVQGNLGKVIDGKQVDPSEVAELENVKKRIEADEAKVYGQHDMMGAVKDLAEWGKGLNAPHMASLEVDLRNTIAANQNSSDSRYRAKLFRDLATIYLSSAYEKQDSDPQSAAKLLGGDTITGRQAPDIAGQQRGFDGALDCIARAAELDSTNPDLSQLYVIAQQINGKLPGNIQKQMNDPKYNPLQIRQ